MHAICVFVMALYLHHAELVGRQAREAATCAFIIYKRMNIKDYDGKPTRTFKNSRFALNFSSFKSSKKENLNLLVQSRKASKRGSNSRCASILLYVPIHK